MAVAQEVSESAPDTAQTSTVGNPINSLAGEFLKGNYINVYGLVNAAYDSTQQTLQSANTSGGGFSIGGGILASHAFSTGLLTLNYRGDYRNYSNGFSGSGTDEYLSLVFTKRLSRRWNLSFTETAGILFYSNAYFGNLAPSGGGVQTNPFSPSTRFLQSGVYLSYRQSQRLSYTFGGSFFLNRYDYAGAIGSTGVVGSISPSYALTSRTSLGGTYSHDYFVFQHNAGTTNLDGGYFNLSHIFGRNWRANISAGITRAHTYGIIQMPVEVILGGKLVTGYVTGPYNNTSYVPTVQGGLIRNFGRFDVSVSAGHGVNPGNGTYLTSSNTFFGGVISRSFARRSVVSGNIFYSRVSSIANQVAQSYAQTYMTVSYSRILIPHLSAYTSYSYNRYGSLLTYGSSSNNQFLIGLSYNSKNIPLTAF